MLGMPSPTRTVLLMLQPAAQPTAHIPHVAVRCLLVTNSHDTLRLRRLRLPSALYHPDRKLPNWAMMVPVPNGTQARLPKWPQIIQPLPNGIVTTLMRLIANPSWAIKAGRCMRCPRNTSNNCIAKHNCKKRNRIKYNKKIWQTQLVEYWAPKANIFWASQANAGLRCDIGKVWQHILWRKRKRKMHGTSRRRAH